MSDPEAIEPVDETEPDAAARAGIPGGDAPLDDDVYAEYISDVEERLAQQRLSSIEAGRRKGGLAGAAMAGAIIHKAPATKSLTR